MEKCVIFDLDGTLANCEHRRVLALKDNGEFDWDIFYNKDLILQDKINEPIAYLFRVLAMLKPDIYIITGRYEKYREVTEHWLGLYFLDEYKKLYMRKDGDKRPDDVVKKEIYEENFKNKEVLCVFDDRDRVVKMWRSLGLTCLQVADGNF